MKEKDPGVSVLLSFEARGGREDNLLYKQTEQHRNILKDNVKSD